MNEGTKRVSEPSQAPPGPQTSSAGPKTSYWDKINAISTLVVAVCTVIAVLVAGSQLRDQNRQAKTDKILSLVAKFDEKPMREMRAKLACDRLQSSLALFKTRKDIPDELIVQLDFLDTVGLLMQREAVDRDDAWFMFSDSVEHYGADVKKAAEAEHEAHPNDSWNTHFWHMNEAMLRIDERRHIKPEDMKKFYADDCPTADRIQASGKPAEQKKPALALSNNPAFR